MIDRLDKQHTDVRMEGKVSRLCSLSVGVMLSLLPQYVQRLTFMRTDRTVQGIHVHLGDASINLGSFTYTPNEVNKALEMDRTYGVPLKEKLIRAFNKPGVTNTTIENQGPT